MIEQLFRKRPIPEFYDDMYKDGYEPWEVFQSAREKLLR